VPARFLRAGEEQILHDEVGREVLDAGQIQRRDGGGDPVPFLFQEFA
jgi:hypothetical protein